MFRRAETADFSLAIADHRPVFAKFVLHEDCGMTDEREDDMCRIMFDIARLRQAQCREHFCQLLARTPPTTHEVPVDDHELLLTTFWRHCLTQACPWSQCVARNKWYSDYNWTQILMARQERERFFWYGRHFLKLFLARAFRVWANVDTAEVSARAIRITSSIKQDQTWRSKRFMSSPSK